MLILQARLISRFGSVPISLQKYFEHFVAQHWFKIRRERATTIQRRPRPDSIVKNIQFTEPARRFLQQYLPETDMHSASLGRAFQADGRGFSPIEGGLEGGGSVS
jgi:hypothetical protein